MSRIVLKISGEALKVGEDSVSKEKLNIILDLIKILKEKHNIAIVVGGGNFFRGREHDDMNKVTADTIGMLGTVMNALYIKDYLNSNNIEAEVSTPFNFPELLPNLDKNELLNSYNNGKIIIFGGGVGKSGYSTDSGTILAAEKIESDLIVKLTNVDGVYSADPKKVKDAIKYDYLTYDDVINQKLEVMDEYAIRKCKEKNIKILVMKFLDYKDINKYFNNEKIGTIIGD